MNINIDGIDYAPIRRQAGSRAVVVVDKGWIFAGDIEDKDGRIYLSNAVWVFSWTSIGFSRVIKNPENADIRPIADLNIPAASEIFRVPVADNWGLK